MVVVGAAAGACVELEFELEELDDPPPEVAGTPVVGVVGVVATAALAPGCSLATTTPISAVAAVAATTAKRVRCRRWVSA